MKRVRARRPTNGGEAVVEGGTIARGDIEIRRLDSLRGEFERLHQAISQRAYELFCHRDSGSGGPLIDWLIENKPEFEGMVAELVDRGQIELAGGGYYEPILAMLPAVELRQKNGQLEILAAVAGVEAKDLDVQITPEDVLIKADVDHRHTAEAGTVHVCEFSRGKVFRSIRLPERIDPETVKAEYRNGLLRLTASIAAPVAKKVTVQAA